MNDNKSNKFKSYIELAENDLQALQIEEDTHARLMLGEALIREAHNVIMYAPMALHSQGLFGVLSVTNFKFSFIRGGMKTNEIYQQNLILGENEVCLSSIDTVYQIGDRGSRRKLNPGQNVSGKIKGLQVICKNMRMFTFSFKNSTVDSGKNITNALMHHAFPKRHILLFAYDYKEDYYNYSYMSGTVMFSHVRDWKREMERTRTARWRISTVNQNFYSSHGLPQAVVVPTSVTEAQLTKAAEHFQNRFFPVWVWSALNGAALVRMADMVTTIPERTQENIMLENVRKSHPSKKQPRLIDLTKECPIPKEVQSSYIKFRELCTPETIRQFWIQDGKFYSTLESSRWLQYVSQILIKSLYAAEQLNEETTVVLQEGEGQDMCCVVSSLTQLILDPYWRTLNGFQSLIQKEWVSLGHQFAKRLGHVVKTELDQSPLFLLFLDGVWQLLQQFPKAFEFSETYLTSLWDSAHISIFETFLFDSEHDRLLASKDSTNPVILRSVWDWGEQFPDKERELFINPLFKETFKKQLTPLCNICNMEIWSQCYFRWIPFLEIPGGGKPQIDIQNRITKLEVQNLQRILATGDYSADMNGQSNEQIEDRMMVNSFYPFSNNTNQMSALQGTLTLNSNLLKDDGMLDSQSIMNAPD